MHEIGSKSSFEFPNMLWLQIIKRNLDALTMSIPIKLYWSVWIEEGGGGVE